MASDDDAGKSASHLLTIYEATNEGRGERYIGTTVLLSEALAQEFHAHPPVPVAHWRPEESVHIRCISYAVAAKDVRSFIKAYAASAPLKARTMIQADIPE